MGSVWGDSLDLPFQVCDGYGNNPNVKITGFFNSANLHKWHHVVGVYRAGSKMEIYWNGALAHASTSASIPAAIRYATSGPDALRIGRRSDSSTAGAWAGRLSDVRIYARALSGGEVADLYGKVGDWPLAEGEGTVAYDLSAHANDGDIKNTPWVSSDMGMVLDFDGALSSTRRVEIPDTPDLDITGELTVSAWVYATAAPDLASNPTGEGRTALSRYRWAPPLEQGGEGETGWNLGAVWRGTPDFSFTVCGTNSSGTRVTKTATVTGFFSPLHRWVHVTGVYKPGVSVSIYTNGVLSAVNNSTIPVGIRYSVGDDALRIGRRPQNQSRWAGHISDVQIYRKALEPSEIAALYGTSAAPVILSSPLDTTVVSGQSVTLE
ncbi:MAG: LamG-like jellyroll fold domain-containing protein, partial [Kiritimatiellia bacterium]|nr:LamG-like jellyroll fold domain-containing protein [Kiritimatiellia bacterium]